jgi:hypothetical protein
LTEISDPLVKLYFTVLRKPEGNPGSGISDSLTIKLRLKRPAYSADSFQTKPAIGKKTVRHAEKRIPQKFLAYLFGPALKRFWASTNCRSCNEFPHVSELPQPMLHKSNALIVASLICFTFPVLATIAMNWEQARPYLIVDAKTAKGHVVYLYAPG